MFDSNRFYYLLFIIIFFQNCARFHLERSVAPNELLNYSFSSIFQESHIHPLQAKYRNGFLWWQAYTRTQWPQVTELAFKFSCVLFWLSIMVVLSWSFQKDDPDEIMYPPLFEEEEEEEEEEEAEEEEEKKEEDVKVKSNEVQPVEKPLLTLPQSSLLATAGATIGATAGVTAGGNKDDSDYQQHHHHHHHHFGAHHHNGFVEHHDSLLRFHFIRPRQLVRQSMFLSACVCMLLHFPLGRILYEDTQRGQWLNYISQLTLAPAVGVIFSFILTGLFIHVHNSTALANVRGCCYCCLLLVAGCWLLVACCWLLVACCLFQTLK